MKKKELEQRAFFYYKDKPLVRFNDVIYYGNMYEKYVVQLQIKTYKNEKNQNFTDKIFIQLLKTDSNLSSNQKVVKTTEKDGLFSAIDLADIWLHKALEESSS